MMSASCVRLEKCRLEHLFKNCRSWKIQRDDLRVEVQKKTGKHKRKWDVTKLFADVRCSEDIFSLPRGDRGGIEEAVFFLLNHYSHATYLDDGEIIYSPFPVRCPRGGGTLQAPLYPPLRPVQEDAIRTKGNHKGERKIKPSNPLLRPP